MVDMRCLCKAKLNMTIRPFHCLFNIWFVPAAMVFNILKKKGKIFINFWGNLSLLLHKIYLMRITRTSSVCGILWSIMVYPAGEYTLYRSWTGGWIAGLRLHHQADAANSRNRDRQAETRPVIRTDKQRHVPSSGQTNRDMSRHPDRQTETCPVIRTEKQRHVTSSGQTNRETSRHRYSIHIFCTADWQSSFCHASGNEYTHFRYTCSTVPRYPSTFFVNRTPE